MTLTLRISALEKRYTISFISLFFLNVVLCTKQTALAVVFVNVYSRPFCFEQGINQAEERFVFIDISSADLKSRPTLIRGHFCLHDVVRETLYSACATVGKKLLQRNLAYPVVKVKILRFKQESSAKLFQTCSYLHFLLFPNSSIAKSPFIPQKHALEQKLLIRLHC